MRRTLVLIALVAVLAVAALALTASAQTPPPSSGDWVITDQTTFNNQQVVFRGNNVLVSGNGLLSLTNVDLAFTGAGTHDIRVSTNARLTVSGGSISSSGGDWGATISGGTSAIEGCDLTDTSGVNLLTWKAKVTNCTIIGSSGDGVYVNPSDTWSRPVDVSDNRILNSTDYGINITIGDFGGSDVKVICEGNNVSGSHRTGIRIDANTDKGRFLLQFNELYRNMDDGLNANFDVRVVEIRIDDIRAHNNTDYGIYVTTYSSTMLAKYLYRVTSIGNGGEGVYISFNNQHWDRPMFRDWYVWDNKGGGIQFRNFNCATLEDSYCVNNESQTDYAVTNTNLEIYRTTHRKGQARVSGGAYMITSFRYLNLNIVWQNRKPCRGNTVQFDDNAGNTLFAYGSTYEGWLGNHTEWDWRVREMRTSLRHTITPYLVGGSQRLTGASFEFDRDLKGELMFHDIQTPDLVVEEPGSNHVQNKENLTIKGTCNDAHSGPNIVQISFDPNPVWKDKSWENATGTYFWVFIRDPFPDGVVTIFVRAFDNANFPNGMYANITITNVTVDTTAPNLTIIQPPPTLITNQSQLTVLGTTDPDVVSLTLNGEQISAFGGTFNKPVQLNEGINNIVIIATDYAGNIANVTRKITLDSIPPILVVRSPEQEFYTNNNTVIIGGITDAEGVTLKIDGDPIPVMSGGTWSHTVTLVKGWNSVLIDAVDIALNHRVITHKMYYDPDPPNINVFKPQPNEIINSSVFLLEGTTDTDVLNSQIRVNGIWIGLDNFAFSTDFTLLDEGEVELEFFARDRAGNERTIFIPIVIDTTAPAVADLLPIDGEIVNTHVINVTGTTEADATLYINGRYVTMDAGGSFREQINLEEEGDNDLNIRVTDLAGNVRAIHRIINLDTVPPEIFVDELSGEFIKTSSNFHTLTGNTEPTANLVIEYGRDKDPDPAVTETIPVDEEGEFSYPVMVGKNKTTRVVLRSTDYAGNTNTKAFLIKREVEEEPGFFETHPEALWGIIIVVIVLLVAYPLTKMSLNRTYDRRLKVMGYATQTYGGPGQGPPPPPPDQRTPGPPTRGPPNGRRPPPPPGARGKMPPRPPAEGEGGEPSEPRAPPRPPTEEEGGAPAAPRPPREDE